MWRGRVSWRHDVIMSRVGDMLKMASISLWFLCFTSLLSTFSPYSRPSASIVRVLQCTACIGVRLGEDGV